MVQTLKSPDVEELVAAVAAMTNESKTEAASHALLEGVIGSPFKPAIGRVAAPSSRGAAKGLGGSTVPPAQPRGRRRDPWLSTTRWSEAVSASVDQVS
jgi:hypothetical protein